MEYAIDGRHLRDCIQTTPKYALWSTYANGGPMAIPTLASVDSHVILIILYDTLDNTGNAACLCEQSAVSRNTVKW